MNSVMKLHVIHTGFFKLDGGAMFGVVPKTIWQRLNPADENNLCTWAMRCLLVEAEGRLILIDTGIGDKQDEKFFSHYHLHGSNDIEGSLRQAGFSPDDVTDVILTHLHFDHCGGAVKRSGDQFVLTFPQATYWSNAAHYAWAINPNAREKASFLKENILPIEESGQLRFIDPALPAPFPGIEIMYVSGHTEKMMLPKIHVNGKVICYMADLIPSTGHIPLPYIMSYDTRPLLTLEEKAQFLKEAADRQYILFFEHDPVHECCTVQHTKKGIRLDRTFTLEEVV
jgi:glyoxylase-like metal-dependent hydrolase (beta-lactamase superfamily II)